MKFDIISFQEVLIECKDSYLLIFLSLLMGLALHSAPPLPLGIYDPDMTQNKNGFDTPALETDKPYISQIPACSPTRFIASFRKIRASSVKDISFKGVHATCC